MSESLDELIREAREDLGAAEASRVDWAAVDRRLFARIEQVQRARRARPSETHGWRWAVGGVAVAAAAAAAIVIGRTREPVVLDAPRVAGDEPAGAVVAVEGDAVVGGRPAAVGTSLGLGDVIEARHGRLTVERPGKLTLLLEPGARATVTHVQGALVLALDAGALEAQVVPVPNGEAFAVDVERARVAVHGTHLRVERAGERVLVDLTEGVVSVGEAPRLGSTLGDLVTAPAHVEFLSADPPRTLAVTHESSAVRAPLVLGAPAQAGKTPLSALPLVPAPKADASAAAHTPAVPGAHGSGHGAHGPASSQPDPNAESTITAVVRACMAEQPTAENVTIAIRTTLRLEVGDDGNVRAARFDPPVAPDINACASSAIYRTRFVRSGPIDIAIDFKN
jgi:hypothetical protein